MTGPEHYTTAEELIKEAAKHRAAAEENIASARHSHLPEKDAYVIRAQVYALIYSGMVAEANAHATLASAAATAMTGPVAKSITWNMDLNDWGRVASDQYPDMD